MSLPIVTEVRAEVSRTRTTRPEEGTTPGPRDPVSVRATIGSIVEERKREIQKRLTGLRSELQSLVLELAVLDATAEVIGIVGDE